MKLRRFSTELSCKTSYLSSTLKMIFVAMYSASSLPSSIRKTLLITSFEIFGDTVTRPAVYIAAILTVFLVAGLWAYIFKQDD